MPKTNNKQTQPKVRSYISRRSGFQYVIDVLAAAFVIDVIIKVASKYFNI